MVGVDRHRCLRETKNLDPTDGADPRELDPRRDANRLIAYRQVVAMTIVGEGAGADLDLPVDPLGDRDLEVAPVVTARHVLLHGQEREPTRRRARVGEHFEQDLVDGARSEKQAPLMHAAPLAATDVGRAEVVGGGGLGLVFAQLHRATGGGRNGTEEPQACAPHLPPSVRLTLASPRSPSTPKQGVAPGLSPSISYHQVAMATSAGQSNDGCEQDAGRGELPASIWHSGGCGQTAGFGEKLRPSNWWVTMRVTEWQPGRMVLKNEKVMPPSANGARAVGLPRVNEDVLQ